MADLNKVMILGNVGKDPEIRYTANGTAVATFSVAANRRHRAANGDWNEETEWFNVVAWEKLAERVSQSVQRGDRVYVEGRLQTRFWEGREECPRCKGRGQLDGGQCRECRGSGRQRMKAVEVVAQNVLPQGRRQQPVAAGGGYGAGAAGDLGGNGAGADLDMSDPDDLPFD